MEIEVGGLNAEVSQLQADLAAANTALEVKVAEAKAAEAAAQEGLRRRVEGQGATFRAVAERVVFAESFSRVAARLATVVGGNIVEMIFEQVQRAVPDLDWSVLGLTPVSEKVFRQRYARILLDALTSSLVLKELDAHTELLSAEQISELPIDRDVDLEPVLQRLKAGEEVSSEDEEKEADEEEEDEEE